MFCAALHWQLSQLIFIIAAAKYHLHLNAVVHMHSAASFFLEYREEEETCIILFIAIIINNEYILSLLL